MAEHKTKIVKKRRIKITGIIFILVILTLIFFVGIALYNLPIKQIYITGTNLISDNEIIENVGIKDYPPIYKLNIKNMINTIKENELVKDVKIKRNIFGKLSINIEEEKVLFLNREKNVIVLGDGKEIVNNYTFVKIPILINHVPDKIYNELITGLYKIDYDIVSLISEIEYSPSKNNQDEIIDNTRFYLRMNDGNAVIMNTVNIKRLNKYNTIYASIGDEKGTMHLDSMLDESIYFKSFESEKEVNDSEGRN